MSGHLRRTSRARLGAVLLVVLLAALPAGAAEPVDAVLRQARAAQDQGLHRRAIDLLTTALAEAERRGEPEPLAMVLGGLGSAYLQAGQPDRARPALERSLGLAQRNGLVRTRVAVLTDLGNLLVSEGRLEEALDTYDTATALARSLGRRDLLAHALIDGARAALRRDDPAGAERRLEEAAQNLAADGPRPDLAFDLLAVARLLLDLPPTPERRAQAYATLRRAAALADETGDQRLLSYAMGYMAQLYEAEARADEALALSRRAAWLAEQARSPDPLYAWQRQIGRLLAAKGRTGEAIAAYQDAVRTLDDIRLDLPTFDPRTGRSLFREVVGPIFLELTDLLLKQAARVDPASAQTYLKEARLTVETTKAIELEDYFQDDCVAQLQARIRPVDRIGERTAALYPIVLPDRTELLLSLPDGTIARATTPVGAGRIAEEATSLRRGLETRANRRYLPLAQQLYGWLLRPFEDALARQRIDTLVFIPDGALRTVPLAALHDGQRFVVERFAVATEPGLNLLDPRPIERTRLRLLLAGLTKGVQGFTPLPHVEDELKALARQHPGVLLLDEAFVTSQVQRSLEAAPFSVVHIASHAQFTSDPKNSFLLTFDGRLDVDGLERLIEPSRFRDRPVELLTLSACTTAAGDDRAALGLAGIAVKAGARSALASLWFINDEAAAELVTAFYDALAEPGATKARALQEAQLHLLRAEPRYRHPAYWAAFLIIGNWL
ncbi:CHAT domain-containing protein [Benzoatithermus flavus]|uniref:CHAT domain-containing protein n=1 Tax=Benzoatithermus flavus TaxID=3108223 RepID=A0ABU8XS28_9PROT